MQPHDCEGARLLVCTSFLPPNSNAQACLRAVGFKHDYCVTSAVVSPSGCSLSRHSSPSFLLSVSSILNVSLSCTICARDLVGSSPLPFAPDMHRSHQTSAAISAFTRNLSRRLAKVLEEVECLTLDETGPQDGIH